ncbi:MAG: substrate binding domain-containing protein, partial [Pseudomonadota bacterium]
GGFDLALRNDAVEDSSLIGRKLADDTRILCAAPEYLKQFGTPRNPEALVDHAHIVFMNRTPRQLTLQQRATPYHYPPKSVRPRIICDDGASMRIAAKAGAGICMSSLWSVFDDLNTGALERVLPDYEINDHSAIWLVYPKSNALTSKTRVLIDFLVEKIGRPPVWER